MQPTYLIGKINAGQTKVELNSNFSELLIIFAKYFWCSNDNVVTMLHDDDRISFCINRLPVLLL